ncbi:hypothetical protein [Hymenobacter aerophilus]|uniref:hypothetical protein n=1 Tax=Hymenobacter aerophilus TaxID=119644 RepID=UPI00035E6620|nr:hypothetical protein [Hymenobacter aerophilus]
MRFPLLLPALAAFLLTACGDTKNPNGMPDEPRATGQEAQVLTSADVPDPDPATVGTEKAVLPADTSVAGAWVILEGSLRGHDAETFNQLIDPEYGLWLLEQSGGKPQITRVADVKNLLTQTDKPLFSLDKKLMDCPTPQVVERLPEPNCPAGTFAQKGCFNGPSTQFRAQDFWQTATLNQATRNQAQAAVGRCVRGVLQTTTGYQFHFSKSAGAGGRWRIVFIDLRGACAK